MFYQGTILSERTITEAQIQRLGGRLWGSGCITGKGKLYQFFAEDDLHSPIRIRSHKSVERLAANQTLHPAINLPAICSAFLLFGA